MTEKQTKRRLIITNVLFWLGLSVCLCAIGHLDYLNEQRITFGPDELRAATIKAIGGLALMGAGMFVGSKLEIENNIEEEDKHCSGRETQKKAR